ncbi:hypothetical protein BJ508DRAFT_44309 [Ascobolus immersus RN42]|uniref:DUF2306 domain-containing protein n=1 Tax=Ascobolus immersus RN42 TaxID=1160509 RepID=A0A3N4HN65_ASCIM|nr:hypothetical protein BJ508DRAFT_44309 [Ascobolus immersus RN42]
MAPSALLSTSPTRASSRKTITKPTNETPTEKTALLSKPKLSAAQRFQKYLGFKTRSAYWATLGLSIPWLFLMCINGSFDLDIEGVAKKNGQDLGILGEVWLFRPEEYLMRKAFQIHVGLFCLVGAMAIFQFIPAIRQYSLKLHRYIGYFVLIGAVVGTGTGWFFTPPSFGGSWDENVSLYAFGLMFLIPSFISWRRIRQGKIQEHKEWAIRGMVTMGGALTMRVMMLLTSFVIVYFGRWDGIWTCNQFLAAIEDDAWVFGNYPVCRTDVLARIVVPATAGSDVNSAKAGRATAYRFGFGTAMWIGMVANSYLAEYLVHRSRKNLQERSVKL